MELVFYILILVPLFFIAFFAGFMGNKTPKKQNKKPYNYYYDQKENNDYADFLHYDGSKNKGDN